MRQRLTPSKLHRDADETPSTSAVSDVPTERTVADQRAGRPPDPAVSHTQNWISKYLSAPDERAAATACMGSGTEAQGQEARERFDASNTTSKKTKGAAKDNISLEAKCTAAIRSSHERYARLGNVQR